MASASRPLTRYASAPAAATGVNRPSTRSTPAAIWPPAADVGQDVGVLEAHIGQRLLEAVESRAAPQAEGLLQAMRDQQRAEPETQQHQTEILGAAPLAGPVVGLSPPSISVGSAP